MDKNWSTTTTTLKDEIQKEKREKNIMIADLNNI